MGKIWFTSDLHFGHNKEFLYGPRGFNNIFDHDNTLIENWNKTVDEKDEVYILGDLMLNDNTHGCWCFNQLNGIKHIILGNHDTTNRIELYKDLRRVVDIQYAMPFKYGKFHFYLSHYPTLTANYDDKHLSTKTICLCGHTHTSDKFSDWDKGIIYHCELDAHNMYPVEIETIIEDIRSKYQEEKT